MKHLLTWKRISKLVFIASISVTSCMSTEEPKSRSGDTSADWAKDCKSYRASIRDFGVKEPVCVRHDGTWRVLTEDEKARRVSDGSLSKEEIEGVIRANLGEIKTCFNTHIQESVTTKGRIVTNFIIGPEGNVQSADVTTEDSELEVPEFQDCIQVSIKAWVFPKPRGGGIVQVKYPFVFNRNR